ncbi:MAG: nicotinate (nicotinamide) nucleotide adenylyltransferase [Alphaproteobacteria bacterium]|nr:nicotinate (nicotinamide) nucleotide adenylyltransferase [Alphaproteobacteria bacterium]
MASQKSNPNPSKIVPSLALRDLRKFHARRGCKIGLMGGSFNPPHDGHGTIALLALRRLHLDAVWWLVTPQNPLKPASDYMPLATRVKAAQQLARKTHPAIYVTSIEHDLATRYSIDTIRGLKKIFPRQKFVWLMGGDNLRQMQNWRNWAAIFKEIPMAVFARPINTQKSLNAMAAQRFARNRHRREDRAQHLVGSIPPKYVYFHTRLMPISSTILRQNAGQKPI